MVTEVWAEQRIDEDNKVYVHYKVHDPDGDPVTVYLFLSDDGRTFPIHCSSVEGNVGPGITPGDDSKVIWWDADADYPGYSGDDYVLRVVADDGKPGGWIEDFSDLDESLYEIYGNCGECAYWVPGAEVFRITPATSHVRGRIIYLEPQLLESFVVEFDFRQSGTADGMVFVWTVNPWAGSGGGGTLNWAGGVGYGIEIDIYRNIRQGESDPPSPHIAIVENGVFHHLAYSTESSANNGSWHHVRIENDQGHVTVEYDGGVVIDHTIAGYTGGLGYYRVSGTTGDQGAVQEIDNISVTNH